MPREDFASLWRHETGCHRFATHGRQLTAAVDWLETAASLAEGARCMWLSWLTAIIDSLGGVVIHIPAFIKKVWFQVGHVLCDNAKGLHLSRDGGPIWLQSQSLLLEIHNIVVSRRLALNQLVLKFFEFIDLTAPLAECKHALSVFGHLERVVGLVSDVVSELKRKQSSRVADFREELRAGSEAEFALDD